MVGRLAVFGDGGAPSSAFLCATLARERVHIMRRSDRERDAYDTVDALQKRPWIHRKFPHIFDGPNARRGEALFFDAVRQRAQGGRVLELGCGTGGVAERLVRETDAIVLATDISSRQIEQAQARAIPGRLTFKVMNAEDPIDGHFDLIYGRGVLHHIDFRPALAKIAENNLNPGGAMVFREPLGANLMGAVYRVTSRDDHTKDERPVNRSDLRWLKRTFPGFWYHPYGLTSLPLGALSSLVINRPDNALTRLGDTLDERVLAKVALLRPWYRAAVLVIDPP
jgi:2-polyprenyl-3-methyl-5-hydroxy-6-metoxy-1,4-benzoquinol methylase